MTDPMNAEKGCYTEHGVSGYGVAVKLTHEHPKDERFVRTMAEEMMHSIAVKCMERGARCIGHIKSHVMSEAGAIKADTIGVEQGAYSSGSIRHPVRDLYMAVNSIVQGIREEEVKTATLEGVHEVAEGKGYVVAKEKEHTYFDEFDFTVSKQEYLRQLEEQFKEETNGPRESKNS